MLTITFVAPFGLGQKATVWARTLPLAKELAARGHRVTILIPPWDTPQDAGRAWVDDGVEIVNVPLRGGLLPTVRRLLREIDRRAPDIVHIVKPRAHAGLVQWWLWRNPLPTSPRWGEGPILRWPSRSSLPIMGRAGEGSNPGPSRRPIRPRLFLDADDWEQAWSPINRYPWPVARFLAWQEEWGLRHADGITTASRWLRERVHEYAPHIPTCYLPNGVDMESIHAPAVNAVSENAANKHVVSEHGAPTVLWFTRFIEISPAWMAACWRALCESVPDATLLVAGTPVQPGLDAPFRAALGQVDAGGSQILWRGYVPTAELPQLYASATCAIYPAATVPLNQAKCSVKLATTLLHGVPVVASAVGEQTHYGANGAARLVPAEASPVAFAQAVAALLGDFEARRDMIVRAQQHLSGEYRWSELTAQLERFYAKQVD